MTGADDLTVLRDPTGKPVPGPQVWTGDRWVTTVHVVLADRCCPSAEAEPGEYVCRPREPEG